MERFAQIAKACRTLKYIVVQDRSERFTIRRKIRRSSEALRRSLKWKKKQVTKLCVRLGLRVANIDACVWKRERKFQNIAHVWRRKMIEINWMGKREAKKSALGFAVLEDVQSVENVMASVGLDVNHRVVDVCAGLSIVYIVLEGESEWKIWSELINNV